MDIKKIKNDRNYFWTNHVKYKLLQYGLSPSMVKKVMNHPERTQNGIAPDTTAKMIRKDSKKTKRELWVMYQKKSKVKSQKSKVENVQEKKYNSQTKIISAWIYPGVSPKGKDIYIPDDVWAEIENIE